jgi:tripartite-type tricarboxylate transporter receptor subunit TctC
VKVLIPAVHGGPTDVMARMIQPGLNARLGQPVPIINRPGAGGNVIMSEPESRGPQDMT